MLSRYDIIKELKKGGISIYPFNEEHLKENSYNLTASEYAWSMGSGKVYYDKKEKKFSLIYDSQKTEIEIKKTDKAVYDKQIIFLPHSTTLVVTKETIAVENYIGGAYHSKVGLVNYGLGHIGTMLGPNFCGQSLIALHNVTDEVITEIAKKKPYYFVTRDHSMASDSVATNFDQIFATYSPATVRKVL